MRKKEPLFACDPKAPAGLRTAPRVGTGLSTLLPGLFLPLYGNNRNNVNAVHIVENTLCKCTSHSVFPVLSGHYQYHSHL